jgi:predicted deacylase
VKKIFTFIAVALFFSPLAEASVAAPGILAAAVKSRPLKYHSEIEITAWLKALPAREPDLIEYHTIGTSLQGREIGVVSIGFGAGQNRNTKPAIVINATHHGDEKIATESALHFIETLIADQHHPEIATMLARYTFHIQPMVNPDGHEMGTRDNAAHRDINRDYSYPLRPDHLSFKTPEAQAVRNHAGTIDIKAAIALHSGTDGVLWPWCHTKDAPPDAPFLTRLAWRTARSIGTVARQSYDDYPSSGEFSDFVYWRHRAPALTIEVDRNRMPHPSQINTISARTTRGIMEFMNELTKSDDARDIASNL